MDRLNLLNKDVHSGTEVVAKKKHEKKRLGVGHKPFKNAILYACDMDNSEVYRVKFTNEKKMVKSKTSKFDGTDIYEEVDIKEAHINTDHQLVWAINDKNALRKFEKLRRKNTWTCRANLR